MKEYVQDFQFCINPYFYIYPERSFIPSGDKNSISLSFLILERSNTKILIHKIFHFNPENVLHFIHGFCFSPKFEIFCNSVMLILFIFC